MTHTDPLVERLLRKRRARLQSRMPDDDVLWEMVNPDGPAATARILADAAKIEAQLRDTWHD